MRVEHSPRFLNAFARRGRTGFTLLEVLIAVAVLSMITILIYGAFASLKRSRDGIQRLSDRFNQGRLAIACISRDLQSAYLSQHLPPDQSLLVVKTAFVGKRESPVDRLDFNSFSHRRLDRDKHDSDQAEISYFGSHNPDRPSVIDLARRVSAHPDLEPDKGGRVEVLATDVDLFSLEYLDPTTGQWLETWDSKQAATGQPDRLPLQVRMILVLNGGKRKGRDQGQEPIRLVTTVSLPIQKPLRFALQ